MNAVLGSPGNGIRGKAAKSKFRCFIFIVIVTFVSSCSAGARRHEIDLIESPSSSYVPPAALAVPSETGENAVTDAATPSPLPLPHATADVSALPADFWMDLPVIPEGISDRVRGIYVRGISMGNDPHAFSKVGDCHSTNPYFLADFDLGPERYRLGGYADLQITIEYFSGSFGRASLAAKQGMSTAGVLASLWSDWKQCRSNETPLDCELRLHRPSFVLISLGTNEAYDVKLDKTPFEPRLRRIIEHSMEQGVVPILSTKADNDEGDHYINFVTAKLALEYELPLWNFWKAVQPLPQHGMRSADHLTFAPTKSFADFSRQEYLEYGMQMRNLTALQVLDMVRREIISSQIVAVTPTPRSVPEAQTPRRAGETMVSPVDGMALVYIPPGYFGMGSNTGNPDESPVRPVSLNAYWMDSTEVTNAMFAKFLNEYGNQIEGGVEWLDTRNPLVWVNERDGIWQALSGREDHPIVGVSWYAANAYCGWAGRNLPTEAQWEYAAKGADGFRFPWGDKGLSCNHARYADCGNRPVQVGSLTLGASPFGIFDMAGNVAEWVNDRYAADYYQGAPVDNPTGPTRGYYRVIRGGSWASAYIGLQTAHRDWAGADMRRSDLGFRCALNP